MLSVAAALSSFFFSAVPLLSVVIQVSSRIVVSFASPSLSLRPYSPSSAAESLRVGWCRRAPLGVVFVDPEPSGSDPSFVKPSCAVRLTYVRESERANDY
jgi:hypothetical protein